jgi:hypothetical protein
MTVKELKEEAKLRELKGYSKLKKAELLALLSDAPTAPQPNDLAGLGIRKLRVLAKEQGIKGFMKMSEKDYMKIVETNYTLVDTLFSRTEVAKAYLSLVAAPNQDFGSLTNTKVKETIDDIWCGHFGFTDRLIPKATLDAFF